MVVIPGVVIIDITRLVALMSRLQKHDQTNKFRRLIPAAFACLAGVLILTLLLPAAVYAAGATATLHIVKYQSDKKTVQAEKTVDYQWMEANLPVHGDGMTHYYHQGPVFDGDAWDPAETVNLKDKGAVKGTDIKDLCDLVGGMEPGSELIIHAVDGFGITIAYANIYTPLDIQGPFVLCWYKGVNTGDEDTPGSGFPADHQYSSALQVVLMAQTPNANGQFVFGNTDMKTAMPQEKYQHFYQGLPSTNGLSGKWINELRIYPGGVPAATTTERPVPYTETRDLPRLSIALGSAGMVLVLLGIVMLVSRRGDGSHG
jgi:hypothetical protein